MVAGASLSYPHRVDVCAYDTLHGLSPNGHSSIETEEPWPIVLLSAIVAASTCGVVAYFWYAARKDVAALWKGG